MGFEYFKYNRRPKVPGLASRLDGPRIVDPLNKLIPAPAENLMRRLSSMHSFANEETGSLVVLMGGITKSLKQYTDDFRPALSLAVFVAVAV